MSALFPHAACLWDLADAHNQSREKDGRWKRPFRSARYFFLKRRFNTRQSLVFGTQLSRLDRWREPLPPSSFFPPFWFTWWSWRNEQDKEIHMKRRSMDTPQIVDTPSYACIRGKMQHLNWQLATISLRRRFATRSAGPFHQCKFFSRLYFCAFLSTAPKNDALYLLNYT